MIELKTTNVNYSARAVKLTQPYKLTGLDKLQGYQILGSQVICSLENKPGELGLYFPVECFLSPDFCHANNLYREKSLNSDDTKTGYLEPSGRVKPLKLKGNTSEGLFLPLTSLNYLNLNLNDLKEGNEFNEINGNKICEKYIPVSLNCISSSQSGVEKRKRSYYDNHYLTNFSFHIDTPNIKRNLHLFEKPQKVSFTRKYHGTSAVFAHIPIPRKFNLIERFINRFFPLSSYQYGYIWSSRKVVKGIYVPDKYEFNAWQSGFYSHNIWTLVFNEIRDRIPPGYTLYGEIIGRLPSGKEIQKDYSYGLTGHKLKVYRITITQPTGHVTELSYDSIVAFCKSNNFDYVEGLTFNSTLNIPLLESFTASLSGLCTGLDPLPADVPEEGLVIRCEHSPKYKVFKYKTFAFLQEETKQLDNGLVNEEETI